MAFWNNWGDLIGDLKSIATGKNPMNNAPVAGAPPTGGVGATGSISGLPTTGTSLSDSTDPTLPDPTDPSSTGSAGGGIDWGSILGDVGSYLGAHAGDILKTGGAAATSALDYLAKQQAMKQQQQEFNQTYGLQSNAQQMQAAKALNAAPLMDKGQYLAANEAAPTPFVPRDITKGTASFQQPATGGAAAQLAANDQASANYKAGAGGYNTSTLKAILAKLQGTPTAPTGTPDGTVNVAAGPLPPGAASGLAGMLATGTPGPAPTNPAPAPTTAPVAPIAPGGPSTTINYAGQQFSPQDWETYQKQNNLTGYA